MLLLPPPIEPGAFDLRIARPQAGPGRQIAIRATGSDGRLIAREEMSIASGETLASHRMRLPAEMRNRIARLDIEGQSSAGAAILLDEGWRQRPVGLVGQEEASATQPLLGDLFYLERALAPFAELHRGSIDTLVQSKLAVLVLADVGTLSDAELQKLKVWVEKGGVLLRFAGNWLAQKPDDLLPVQLRGGDRAHGRRHVLGAAATLRPSRSRARSPGSPVPTDVRGAAAGAGGARHRSRRQDLGAADRRHAAGHRRSAAAMAGSCWCTPRPMPTGRTWRSPASSCRCCSGWSRLSQGVADAESAEALPPIADAGRLRPALSTPPAAAIAATVKDDRGRRHQPAPSARLLRPGDTERAFNLGRDDQAQLKPLAALPAGMVADGLCARPRRSTSSPGCWRRRWRCWPSTSSISLACCAACCGRGGSLRDCGRALLVLFLAAGQRRRRRTPPTSSR